MASNSETGHVKNAANFEKLVSYAESIGGLYNPSEEPLKLNALKAQLDSVNNALDAVRAGFTNYSGTIAARETAFKPLKNLISRIGNALNISGVTDEVKQNAKSIFRKLHGERASRKLTDEEKKALEAQGINKKQISASQMSFDKRIENLDLLVKLLQAESKYSPNETDLKAATLSALYTDLKTKNTNVINSSNPLKNARISRNDIMYTDKTGLVDIAGDVKEYMKSLAGVKGEHYKAISKLKFIKYKD